MKMESKKSGKVLILGNDNRAFLSVIRSLGRKNICIHIGWCDEKLYALESKYISKIHNIPKFSLTNNSWKECLVNILKTEKYELVIPCGDTEIIPLQLYHGELNKLTKVYLLDNHCFNIVNDKHHMQKLARNLGINVPKEIDIIKGINLEKIISEISLPLVIKPRNSFKKEDLGKKNYVFKIYTAQELAAFLETVSKTDEFVAQKNFNGLGTGIELLSKDGEILVEFQHVRIHEPLMGGGSSYRKSVHPFPELLDASKKIIKSLNYTGVAMVEFKVDPKNNDWVFIELNARFWGSLPLAVACGIDFPYYLYLMLVKDVKKFQVSYKAGMYCRNVSNDIAWLKSNLKADRTDITLATLPISKVLLEIINIITFKERYDTLVIDDLKPGIYELIDLGKSFCDYIHKKFFYRAIRFQIIRNFLKLKAIKKLNKSKAILFICKGNICRSPFASNYLATKKIKDVIIDSCGYYPIKGRLCPKEAIDAGKIFGANLALHRSKIANDELISHADIIFIFDEENYISIAKKYPYAKNKLFLLSVLNPNTPINIEDPYGKDIEYFTKIYTIIKLNLDSIQFHLAKSLSQD